MIMSKSGKKIISSLMCILTLIIGVCSFSFISYGADLPIYNLQFSEPSYGENQGYINVLVQRNDTGARSVRTFFWITNGLLSDSNGDVYQPLSVQCQLSSTGITFVKYGFGAAQQNVESNMSIFELDQSGYTKFLGSRQTGEGSLSVSWTDYQTLGYIVKGNVHSVSGTWTTPFDVSYIGDDTSSYVWQVIQEVRKSNELWERFESQYLSNYINVLNSMLQEDYKQSVALERIQNLTNSLLGEVHGWFPVLNGQLTNIVSELKNVESRLDSLIEEQKKSNSWLEKIWNSIREFINPTDEDKQKTDDYNNSSSSQKNEMDELNKDNQLDTPDIDDSSSAVDENIDYDSMDEYSGVLAVIVNNKFVIQMILISVSIVIIGYVLFGKR